MHWKTRSRLGGVLIAALGLAGTLYDWHLYQAEGRYFMKLAVFGPMFFGLGLGVIAYPVNTAENLQKYGTRNLPLSKYPLGMKVISALAVALGALNAWAMWHGGL